ncbi:MAG: sigma-70 family RNA polymerase sigma factor [Deltaproteobacteria bacterium]|nr:sigma-70 family RNA polymerase sigma factor [Deltaproteobacteria bacterium]
MDVERFRAGDLEVLRAELSGRLDSLWRLVRRGFVMEDAGAVQVLGAEPEEVEELLVRVLTRELSPARRAEIGSSAELVRAWVDAVVEGASREADRHGRKVSASEVPFGCVDLESARAGAEVPMVGLIDVEAAEEWGARRAQVDAALSAMDETVREVARLRFVEGKSVDATAKSIGKGRAFVAERESRLRRELTRALKGHGARISGAKLDGLIADRAEGPAVITRDRIIGRVFRRIFRDEPAPFKTRASYALSAAAVGLAGWLLMVSGVLPSTSSDVYPAPSVAIDCGGPCNGAKASARILAPKDARAVAILLEGARSVAALLVDPAGGSVSLPFGARERETSIALEPTVTATSGAVVAVFSRKELTRQALLEALRAPPSGVMVVRAPVARSP